nr:MAG TPA: hypothetical protein [Bacteriophage sp.]DAR47905.1 MAG TPA: hypothetical protein [Bacteriophage sp.]
MKKHNAGEAMCFKSYGLGRGRGLVETHHGRQLSPVS